ncbi:TSL-kinase interacting protein 1 isoform X2 [Magnolia sinica]|uniref:TSL-kinase interacting protein 1 isoform X2 n=1 Tax=Magnolia sinica TaxID=86752 RepID=UPI00265A5E1E|nr:TSL-kinase interacting protein 1 isoform X2 [Magnolia sinica]
MQTQPPAALDIKASPSENHMIKYGDSGVPLSSPKDIDSQMPVKRQTRQWAAWTRQEEENFFNALRLVGKNFDKITCRVQSKNKDQVRHYYYRLVRRMNKLLGPGFSLDTKNTKDTISAMLRWWSLLEKYSCTSSKLRLKPRRFKIFVEALEHQLLKDRKKTQKKRPSLGENCPSTPSTAVPLLNKAEGNDAHAVKLLIVDGQNIQKVGSGKAASLKRSVSMNISCNKSDLSSMKTSRQRRRTGSMSSSAYKRWEKAAIAGVSLVADAAEQLERTTTDKRVCTDDGTLNVNPYEPLPPNRQNVAHSLPSSTSERVFSQNPVTETSLRASMKLKLQLFPIDEVTRRALEKDELNPHLELTLSSRKKITSVLEHLSHKWGNSSIASGELMLFPYNIHQESVAASYQRWTLNDTTSSAADVYATIGSPAVFRLRYGWVSNPELQSRSSGVPSTSESIQEGQTSINAPDGKVMNVDATLRNSPISRPLFPDSRDNMKRELAMDLESNLPVSSEHTDTASLLREDNRDGVTRKQFEDVDNMRMSNGATLSAGEWADSLTNISIGDLLSEASRGMDANCFDPPAMRSSLCHNQIPFSCDSFDAAIAAHLSGPQDIPILSTQVSHASIWDAEETCDAFSFQKVSLSREVSSPSLSSSLGTSREIAHSDSLGFHGLVEEFTQIGPPEDPACENDRKANCQSDAQSRGDSTKDLPLTDIYWPDSLGPLDLDISPSRYQAQDLILGESISLSGLNRLIASSLDAFQNCSFFGSDKKESSTSEA